MTVQTLLTQSGDKLVVLTEDAYEDLIDIRRLDSLMDAAGDGETLNEQEVTAYLAAPSPLAFWRERRGMARAALAAAAAIPERELARLQTPDATGDVRAYARLAEHLRVRIEDIVPE